MPATIPRRLILPAWLLLAFALFAHGCGGRTAPAQGEGEAKPPTSAGDARVPVTLQLNWFPEAEHGGYYAALVHGYYRDAGLDVTILPGGPDSPVVQQVARRAVDFGIVNADNILFGRAQQAPVVALMAPLQVSPRCILVHESSGIESLRDLRDLTLAVSSSNAFTQFMRHELKLPGVKIVPYTGSVAQFLVDKNYAQQGYVFSEPFVARKAGGNPSVLMLSEIGFNPYTSTLFTSDALLESTPELAEKMVTASIRGWQQYIRSPQETNAAIHQANPQMDLDVLAYGAKTLEPLVFDQDAQLEGVGTMSRQRWQMLANQLIESGQLKLEQADVDGAFTTRFLPDSP